MAGTAHQTLTGGIQDMLQKWAKGVLSGVLGIVVAEGNSLLAFLLPSIRPNELLALDSPNNLAEAITTDSLEAALEALPVVTKPATLRISQQPLWLLRHTIVVSVRVGGAPVSYTHLTLPTNREV